MKQMRNLAEIQFRDLMTQDPPIHWVLLLCCDILIEYIPIQIVYHTQSILAFT